MQVTVLKMRLSGSDVGVVALWLHDLSSDVARLDLDTESCSLCSLYIILAVLPTPTVTPALLTILNDISHHTSILYLI